MSDFLRLLFPLASAPHIKTFFRARRCRQCGIRCAIIPSAGCGGTAVREAEPPCRRAWATSTGAAAREEEGGRPSERDGAHPRGFACQALSALAPRTPERGGALRRRPFRRPTRPPPARRTTRPLRLLLLLLSPRRLLYQHRASLSPRSPLSSSTSRGPCTPEFRRECASSRAPSCGQGQGRTA